MSKEKNEEKIELLKAMEDNLNNIVEYNYNKVCKDIEKVCFGEYGLIGNKEWIIKIGNKKYEEVVIRDKDYSIVLVSLGKDLVRRNEDILFIMNEFGQEIIEYMDMNNIKNKKLKKLIRMIMAVKRGALWKDIKVENSNYKFRFLFSYKKNIYVSVDGRVNGGNRDNEWFRSYLFLDLILNDLKGGYLGPEFDLTETDYSYRELYKVLLSKDIESKFNKKMEGIRNKIKKDGKNVKKLVNELDKEIMNKKLKLLIGGK